MSQEFDVIVIGAGMAGLSVSAELSTHARVVLLERESQPGYHSTGRSAAAFIPSYGGHLAALNILTRASYPFFAATPNDFTELSLLKQRGMLTVISAESGIDPTALAAEFAGYTSGELSIKNAAQIRQLIPLARDGWSSAVYENDVFDIDVDGLLQGYLRLCRAGAGFSLRSAEVSSIERKGGQWVVTADGHDYIAPIIVNAAGAWADEVASKAGVAPLGLQPLRRTAVLIQLPEGAGVEKWPLIFAADGSFYLKPDAGLLLASPADEHPSLPCDAQPEELDVAFAAHYAEQMLDIKVERVSASWAGLRTFAKDRVPVVGFDHQQPGFFWLAGQGGHGIQIAPALAQLAAQLILKGEVPAALQALGFDSNWVNPGRFSDGPTHGHGDGSPAQEKFSANGI